MSLLNTDITKVKRLSLRESKLPPTERANEPTDRPPTTEERAYERLLEANPMIATLVDKLELVSSKTGKKITPVNKVNKVI